MAAEEHERAARVARSGDRYRVCEECGSDRWKAREFDRIRDRNAYLEREREKLARKCGLLSYQLEEARAECVVRVSGLQRKIVRQARAIVRLEKRAAENGQLPHGGATLADAVPGAEYDAAGQP